MPTVVLHLTRTTSGAQRAVELPSYPVKYHRHLADGRVAEVTLDWPALVKLLGEFDKDPGATRALGLGRALRAALLPSGWESVEASLADALQGGEATLVIQTNADELYALPWEAMPFGLNGPPLADVANLTLLYHEPGVNTPLAPVDPPRAALLAWSAGEKKVPHERVTEALGPTRTLDEPSLDQLVEALRIGEHDALVLLAHGGRTESGVALRWGEGRLTPAQLVAALRGLPHRPAQVVVLACRAGEERAESVGFGGFGVELHRLGVPFVLASRWKLSFSGAVALAKGLRGGDLRSDLRAGQVDGLGLVAFGSGVTVAATSRRALSSYHDLLRERVEGMPWLSQQLGFARSISEVYVRVEVCEEANRNERGVPRGSESVPLSAVLGPARARWVMLGDPGSGKSTLLRRLALDLVAGGAWLPVLLHAGDLGQHDSLGAAIKAVWGLSAARLVASWSPERLAVLVDGLDEVGEPREVRKTLLAHATELGAATLIVAGRPEGAPETWPRFGTLRLQPLTDGEQEHLLTNLGVSTNLIQSQLPRLRAHSRLREIVGRPLLLTLAALVLKEDGGLPNKRSALYERAIKILLERHKLNHDAPVEVVRAPDDMLAALVALAPKLLREGEGPWTRDRCITLLRSEQEVMERLSHTWPIDPAANFLRESGRTLGLLTPQDDGRRYGFSHRSLGEYLASVQLVADPEARAEAVQEGLQHPARWAEVLALTVSQLNSVGADALVRSLVNAGEAGRGVLYRVLASAEGLSGETVREVLKLDAGWREGQRRARQTVIEGIPALVKDLLVAVGLLEQVARSTTCGHDLFWVREVLRRIEHGEVAKGTVDDTVEEAKHAAKGAAGNVLSHLNPSKREALVAMLRPWWRSIPSGSFEMGSLDEEDEKPIHRVTIVSGFQMLGVPVTWAMYCHFDPGHEAALENFGIKLTARAQRDVPVYNVSWYAATMFAEWVGARLPLESEWEYACRAGTKTRYWSGDSSPDIVRVGWIGRNSGGRLGDGYPHSLVSEYGLEAMSGRLHSGGHPQPVSKKHQNAWGLHDVHGNVWEWCLDVYSHSAYAGRRAGFIVDPITLTNTFNDGQSETVAHSDLDMNRVVRGGSWNYGRWDARSASRNWGKPVTSDNDLGFRLVLPSPDPPNSEQL